MPRVSIIMGVYNGFGRMDRSIQSIINQTYKDWEFIICDDGSTDDTYMKLQEYAALDNRIVVLKNAHNSGLAQSLNNCLSVAKGEYVARMDDDDYSHSERLEKEVYFLNQHPEYAIVALVGIWLTKVAFGGKIHLSVNVQLWIFTKDVCLHILL